MLLTDVFPSLYLKAELRANVFLALEEQDSQKVSAHCMFAQLACHRMQSICRHSKHA